MLSEIGEEDFEREVLDANSLVVIDFFAPFCVPCVPMAERLENVSRDYPGVRFYQMNTIKYGALAGKLNIKAVPTLIFFKGGDKVNTEVGLVHEDKIKSMIEEAL